ncbi:MAG: GNAT family N-acetyltransferase [Alkalispirochaeta sp.]
MDGNTGAHIRPLTPELEGSIRGNPLLNIDTYLIPSPYIRETEIEKDYDHSFAWIEEGEVLGFILVYSSNSSETYLIYELVISPFARGRGIGSALGRHLLQSIDPEATVYLYVWEKHTDTLEFFLKRGFEMGRSIVYRNLVYFHLHARSGEVLAGSPGDGAEGTDNHDLPEEIGRTRHDARKTIRFLSSMVDMLSIENCGRIIEDINRETTYLVNTLNSFRDSMSRIHEVNITNLILERIVPYVGAAPIQCELRLKLQKPNVIALGNYVSIGRAFVNIVANALESIAASGRTDGIVEVKIAEDDDGTPYVRFRDNGIGMTSEQLEPGRDGVPAFVGRTTKNRKEGEGLGSIQIFSTFGPENITVDGRLHRGCSWKIRLRKPTSESDPWFTHLEQRYHVLTTLTEDIVPGPETPRQDLIAYVWQTRKIEIFLFDVILHFSAYHNIRTIHRTVLSYFMGDSTDESLRRFAGKLRVDREILKRWLVTIAQVVKDRWGVIAPLRSREDLRGAMLKSYGQAIENVMIFTLDPASGESFATDRKLAEHLDFAPYLGGDRERLVRGEFTGDMNNDERPIFLGVWSIDSEQDLEKKLRLIQRAARTLIEIGIHREKKLAFYQTTYIRHTRDINSDAVTTFGEFADLSPDDLFRYAREADDELQGYISALD